MYRVALDGTPVDVMAANAVVNVSDGSAASLSSGTNYEAQNLSNEPIRALEGGAAAPANVRGWKWIPPLASFRFSSSSTYWVRTHDEEGSADLSISETV